MTDEGQAGDPMDAVELAHAMKGVAASARQMYAAFVDEGFSEPEALKLLGAWLHGSAGGKLS